MEYMPVSIFGQMELLRRTFVPSVFCNDLFSYCVHLHDTTHEIARHNDSLSGYITWQIP